MNHQRISESLKYSTVEHKEELVKEVFEYCCSRVEHVIESIEGKGSTEDFKSNDFGSHKVKLRDVVMHYALPEHGLLHKLLVSIARQKSCKYYQYAYDEKDGLVIKYQVEKEKEVL